MFDTWADNRFVKLHDKGADNQEWIYRCMGCHRLVTWKKINLGGCGCGINKVYPTNPTLIETIRLLFLPWTI